MIGIGIGTHRRRVQDFLPDNVANLAVWLRADQGITIPGGAVEFWDFINGTFRGVFRMGQGAGANRPTHIVNDPVYNNQSTVSFDGGDHLDAPNFSSALTQPNTYFIVGNLDAIGVTNTFMDRAGGASRNLLTARAVNDWQLFAGISLFGGVTNTNSNIFEFLYNGASSELLINGAGISSGNVGAQALDSLRVGDSFALSAGLSGKIAELIIYDANLSVADRTAVRNYLNTRYAIF